MLALGNISSCLWSSGISVTFSESAFLIFSFISAAAALVKVTISMESTGIFSSVTIFFIRSTRTAVFPAPAAAETNIFLSLCSMV